MNIFFLSEDPYEAAQWQCDKHIVKMGVEACQILSSCFLEERLSKDDCPCNAKGEPRKHYNPNSRFCKWVKTSTANMEWLMRHAFGLFQEKYNRYPEKGRHFTHNFLDWIVNHQEEALVLNGEFSPPPIAIKDNCECRKDPSFNENNPVLANRLYYIHDKPFATWIKNKPYWMK